MKLIMLAVAVLCTGCAAIDKYTHADIRKTSRPTDTIVWEGSGPSPLTAEAAQVCMYNNNGKNFVKSC